ncbi:MAG TPA: DUF255 domain-containing protein, partial [Psychromonas hadalis]|nr:DUF255 domain-containing protein [Psychromonas hadalis]
MKLLIRYFLFVVFLLPTHAVYANELKNNASPYLAMHGNDPVNWMAWGKT